MAHVGALPRTPPYDADGGILKLIDGVLRYVERLQAGELDLIVASLSFQNPDLLWTELFRDPTCLVVAPEHRLASATVAEWAAVRGERLLVLKEGHCFRDQVLTACTRRDAQMQAIFESDQFSSIFPLVA